MANIYGDCRRSDNRIRKLWQIFTAIVDVPTTEFASCGKYLRRLSTVSFRQPNS